MSEPKIFFSKDKLDWLTMVGNFAELCRIFERWVEDGRESKGRKELFQNLWGYADYFDKHKEQRSEELFGKSTNRYDAQNCYEEMYKEQLKIRDLVEQLSGENLVCFDWEPFKQQKSIEIVNLEASLKQKKYYLRKFFGIDYQEMWPPKKKFQFLQLILILFRCEQENNKGVLSEIESSSFWRFRNEEKNPYCKAIGFIRSELLKGLSFKDAAAIEHFAGQIRFGVHNVEEAIVNRVIKIKRFGAPISDNEIKLELQRLISCNLKELTPDDEPELLQENITDLFWRAYLHFLLLGVTDSLTKPYLNLCLEALWEDKPIYVSLVAEHIWSQNSAQAENYDKNNDSVFVCLGSEIEELEKFINNEIAEIVQRIWGGSTVYICRTMRRYNSAKVYTKLAKLYCCYNLRASPHKIDINELLGIIFLLHACVNREKGKCFLTSRKGSFHGGDKKHQEKQIRSIISELDVNMEYNLVFWDKEERWYELASFMNTLEAMLKNEIDEMVENRRQISEKMFAYLKRIVPLSPEVKPKYKNLTEIAESIVSKNTLEQYCRWKEKKSGFELFDLD